MRMKMKCHLQGERGRGPRMLANKMEGHRGSRGGRFAEGRGEGREGGMHRGRGDGLGDGFGGDHGRGRGGRAGRRRMFAGGELRLLLLKLIADESRHGYELIKAIEDLTGGQYAPSPGIVYPTLSMLVDEGVIEQQGDSAARKAFVVTEAGVAELAEKSETAQALIARLQSLADAENRHGTAPIRRAAGNLFAVLRNRANLADLATETVHQIVDVLDDAARRIERL
jgi:DNA-binding PadR family transcriptional regulator